MPKLVPHWGQTALLGKTYHYKKIMNLIFCIVDSSNSRQFVYLVEETVAGDKYFDQFCSFLMDYSIRMVQESARFLRVYLDAAPYFKNKFTAWWAAELILQGSLSVSSCPSWYPSTQSFSQMCCSRRLQTVFTKQMCSTRASCYRSLALAMQFQTS